MHFGQEIRSIPRRLPCRRDPAAFVPEGHLRITRRFNAELAPGPNRVPQGRLNQATTLDGSR